MCELVTGVQTCALPIYRAPKRQRMSPLLCVLRLPRLETILKVLQCPKQLTSPRFSIEIHRSKAFRRVILAILLTGPRSRMMRREYSPALIWSRIHLSVPRGVHVLQSGCHDRPGEQPPTAD